MDKTSETEQRGLLFLTRAYNRGEISFEEWLRLTRVWAETVIAQAPRRPKLPRRQQRLVKPD